MKFRGIYFVIGFAYINAFNFTITKEVEAFPMKLNELSCERIQVYSHQLKSTHKIYNEPCFSHFENQLYNSFKDYCKAGTNSKEILRSVGCIYKWINTN